MSSLHLQPGLCPQRSHDAQISSSLESFISQDAAARFGRQTSRLKDDDDSRDRRFSLPDHRFRFGRKGRWAAKGSGALLHRFPVLCALLLNFSSGGTTHTYAIPSILSKPTRNPVYPAHGLPPLGGRARDPPRPARDSIAAQIAMKTRHRAYAYITNGSRLLLFIQPEAPEAGIQVPAGTIEPGENLQDAVIREAKEEMGLTELRCERFLAQDTRDMRDCGRDELQYRWFFHLGLRQPASRVRKPGIVRQNRVHIFVYC